MILRKGETAVTKEIPMKLCNIHPTVKHVDSALRTNQTYKKDKFEIVKRSYTYRLMCVMEGTCEFVTKYGCRVLKKGDICFLRPGDEYNTLGKFSLFNIFFSFSGCPLGEADQLYAYGDSFRWDWAETRVRFTDNPLFNKPFFMEELPEAFRLAQKISSECTSRSVNYQTMADAYLTQLLIVTARLLDENQRKPYGKQILKLSEQIVQYVNENLTTVHTAADVCRVFNYHPAYINRILKITTGTTLHRYIMDSKLCYADSLIKQSDRELTEIAQMLGFCDSSHFGKQYRKKFGKLPSKVRKQAEN